MLCDVAEAAPRDDRWNRRKMGAGIETKIRVTRMPVVQAEKARIGNGEMELDERGDPLFPRVELWVSLEVQREECK